MDQFFSLINRIFLKKTSIFALCRISNTVCNVARGRIVFPVICDPWTHTHIHPCTGSHTLILNHPLTVAHHCHLKKPRWSFFSHLSPLLWYLLLFCATCSSSRLHNVTVYSLREKIPSVRNSNVPHWETCNLQFLRLITDCCWSTKTDYTVWLFM